MTSVYYSAVSKPKSHSAHPLFLLFISPLHLSLFHPFHPAVSLALPELIGENHVVAEAWETDDGGWDVCFQHWSGCSERVLLGWQVKCAEKWVMMPVLCVCVTLTVSCSFTVKKSCEVRAPRCPCFNFTYCWQENLVLGPGWNEACTADGLELKGWVYLNNTEAPKHTYSFSSVISGGFASSPIQWEWMDLCAAQNNDKWHLENSSFFSLELCFLLKK